MLDVILVLGDSLVTRLERDTLETTTQARIADFHVRFVWKQGADVSEVQQLAAAECYRNVYAVHLEVGTSDLTTFTCPVAEVAASIVRLARWLLEQGVQRVAVGEILGRTANARGMPISLKRFNKRAETVNLLLKLQCSDVAGVTYVTHRDLMEKIGRDGVHLTRGGLLKLWHSVCKIIA